MFDRCSIDVGHRPTKCAQPTKCACPARRVAPPTRRNVHAQHDELPSKLNESLVQKSIEAGTKSNECAARKSTIIAGRHRLRLARNSTNIYDHPRRLVRKSRNIYYRIRLRSARASTNIYRHLWRSVRRSANIECRNRLRSARTNDCGHNPS